MAVVEADQLAEAARELARRTRLAQGLPEKVADVTVLARVARLLERDRERRG
ncbi:MAG: hypothetical protein ACRDHU_06345 [Actinomycetota bacterium]